MAQELKIPITDTIGGVKPEIPSFISPDPPPYKHPSSLDINEVMLRTTRMLQIIRPDLVFTPSYPDYVINYEGKDSPSPTAPDETVTWRIIKRNPGSLSGAPFESGNREVVPRVRENRLDHFRDYRPLNESERVHEFRGQVFDNLVQFDCWSKTNKQTVALLEWFENFMFEFRRLFQEMGVHKTYFWERTDDVVLFQYRNGLQFRSTRYFFRTEKIYAIRLHLIEEIRHRLAVLGNSEVVSQVIN